MHERCLEKGFTDSCKDIILHIVTVALATRYMELSQQYNDNIPAKSFYVHMVLEENTGKRVSFTTSWQGTHIVFGYM